MLNLSLFKEEGGEGQKLTWVWRGSMYTTEGGGGCAIVVYKRGLGVTTV